MNPDRLSIVLSTHAVQFEAVAFTGDLDDNLARIAGWGYAGVELAVRNPDLVDAHHLEKLLTSHGLQVPAIGTGQAWIEDKLSFTSLDSSIRKAAIQRIKSHISLAKRLNALVVIGLIRGVTPPGQSKDQAMRLLVDCLQECVEAAITAKVRLAIEPLNRYETDLIQTAHEGLELVKEIGSASLGLLLDTFHMNIEEVDITESIRQTGKEIFHFHVADSNRWYPSAGHLNFETIFESLSATGYSGWISGEFMPKPDADTAAQCNLEYLKNILKNRNIVTRSKYLP